MSNDRDRSVIPLFRVSRCLATASLGTTASVAGDGHGEAVSVVRDVEPFGRRLFFLYVAPRKPSRRPERSGWRLVRCAAEPGSRQWVGDSGATFRCAPGLRLARRKSSSRKSMDQFAERPGRRRLKGASSLDDIGVHTVGFPPWNRGGTMSRWGVHGARGALQGTVEALMRTLLEDHPTLLDERDIARLMDAEHCKGVPGLTIASFELLRPRDRGHRVSGHARYWKHLDAGRFYVCSQWRKDHHPSNAEALAWLASGAAERAPPHPGAPALRRHITELDAYARASGPAQPQDKRDRDPASGSAPWPR